MSNIKKICIVSAGLLPIPDVMGGAIERLVTMIAEDNETAHLIDLTVISIYKESAVRKQVLKNTNFVNIKTWGSCYYRFAWKMRGIGKKILKRDFYRLHVYERKVEDYLLEHGNEYDLIINEGLQFDVLKRVSEKYGKNRICAHLHCNLKASSHFEEIYGSVIAVSNFIRDKYREKSQLPKYRVGTVFNGIDTTVFYKGISCEDKHKIRNQLDLNDDDFVLVFCGRLVKEKGIKETIEVISKIDIKNIKLLIIGSSDFGLGDRGVYPAVIKRLVSENRDKIKFTGFVPNNQIYKYHKISDVGLIPSLYDDPCPLSMFEMISSGLPTIATALGGMNEIGTEKTTLFIDFNNFHTDLKNKILALYNDSNLRKKLSENALERSVYFHRQRFYNDFISRIISNVMTEENEPRNCM